MYAKDSKLMAPPSMHSINANSLSLPFLKAGQNRLIEEKDLPQTAWGFSKELGHSTLKALLYLPAYLVPTQRPETF